MILGRKNRFFSILVSALFTILPVVSHAESPVNVQAETVTVNQFTTPLSDERSFNTSNTTQNNTTASSTLTVPDDASIFEYSSAPIISSLQMNALGVTFSGHFALDSHDEAQVEVYARVRKTNGEESTIELPIIVDDRKDAASSTELATAPGFVSDVESFTIELILHRSEDGDVPSINSMNIVLMDSSNSSSNTTAPTPDRLIQPLFASDVDATKEQTTTDGTAEETPAAEQSVGTKGMKKLGIIAREEWGADESNRYSSKGTIRWELNYQTPEVFLVHHTAGGDGGTDPAATVNAIYYWHAIVLGWGDIGYNYLIDPAGNIYEGRFGGDAIIGGHAFNSVDNINFNEGSIGIALLGCFEDSEACSTQHSVTPEMEEALSRIISYKADQFGFNPNSVTTFHDREIPRISGHRDVDYTLCPGNTLHADLATVRTLAKAQYDLLAIKPFQGKYITRSIVEVATAERTGRKKLDVSKQYAITYTYKNTGLNTWDAELLRLKLYNGTGKRRTRLAHNSWNDAYGKIQMNEGSVTPGEYATFTVTLDSPEVPSTKKLFTKLFHAKNKVKGSNKTAALTYIQPFAGTVAAHSIPPAMYASTEQEVYITYRNVGEYVWEKADLVLNGVVMGSFKKKELVAPGEEKQYSISFRTPKRSKIRRYVIELVRDGERIPGTRIIIPVRIDPLA